MDTEQQLQIEYDQTYVVKWLLDSLAIAFRDGFLQGYSDGYLRCQQDMRSQPKPPMHFGGIGDII